MLKSRLSDNCQICTAKRVSGYDQLDSGGIKIRFSDGSEAQADVLIGADGVHSIVREGMFRHLAISKGVPLSQYGKYVLPKWSGTFAYRSSVPLPAFKEKYPEHQALTIPKIVSNDLISLCNH